MTEEVKGWMKPQNRSHLDEERISDFYFEPRHKTKGIISNEGQSLPQCNNSSSYSS